MKNYRQQALQNVQAKGRKAELEYRCKMEPYYGLEEFQALSQNYTRLVIENARLIANEMIPEAEKELEAKVKLESYLLQHGLEDKPKYSCEKCSDSGLVGFELCDCVKQEMSRLMIKDSGFNKLEDFEKSIDTLPDNNSGIRTLYLKMRTYCSGKAPTKNLICLSGGVGTGKTHLTKCMAKEFISKGKTVNFVTSQKLSQDMKKISKGECEDLWQTYLKTEVLFVDDFGAETIFRGSTLELMHVLISERKSSGLQTILTTNLTMSEIKNKYGERIFSRIADVHTSICVDVEGEDLRLCKI